MESSSYKCPFCDAPLETLHGQLVPTCTYCGKDIPVGQAIRVDTTSTEEVEALTDEEVKRYWDYEYLQYLKEMLAKGSTAVESRDLYGRIHVFMFVPQKISEELTDSIREETLSILKELKELKYQHQETLLRDEENLLLDRRRRKEERKLYGGTDPAGGGKD